MKDSISQASNRFVAYGARVGWWRVVVAAVAIIALIVGIKTLFFSSKSATTETTVKRLVEVRSVSDLSSESAPFQIVGTVNSKSEATVRAEASGQVIAVMRALGDSVGAGTIVAELENSSARAAVTQAQGALDAAQANLDKVQKGTRTEQLAILQAADDAARSGAVNALLSAYSSVDNAVRGSADTMFSNPESANPLFNIPTSNSNLTNQVQNTRLSLGTIISRESGKAGSLSAHDNLLTEFTTTETEIRTVRSFLDSVIQALNVGIATPTFSQSAIAGYITSATAARTAINGTLTSISTARQTLETAENSLSQGVTGAQAEDIAASQAALKSAQGTLAAARANLEKTIVRAPISGTVNSFSLKVGDYVSQSSPVLTVANNGALEILAYVTEQDARDIAVGSSVKIQDEGVGIVTRIAPALDPITKKIEVRVGVTDGLKSLINGQSVSLTINRVNPATPTKAPSRITIPISAIKVGTQTSVIFTVSSSSELVSHAVSIGALLGDRVEITEGLTGDMQIVTDARGLREGELVTLK